MKISNFSQVFLIAVLSFLLASVNVCESPIDIVIEGAMEQIGKTRVYDGRYVKIGYPNGDVPIERGVCTDVIIRAFRKAGVDLQVLVHEDMKTAFRSYPQIWGLTKPNPNIDHRRVRNLTGFFKRHAKVLKISENGGDYLPGDIVTWILPSGADHIGIVSNRYDKKNKRYLVVHNIGYGTVIEDVLFSYKLTGHFRYF